MILLLLGCSTLGGWDVVPPDDTEVAGPRVVASPGTIDFGTISVNDDGYATGELTLYNIGDVTEFVTGHDEPIGSSAFVVDAPPVIELEPGDELTLSVRFVPTTDTTDEPDAAQLLVDPTREIVRLTGAGAAPVLEVGEPAIDAVVVGCSDTGTVTVTNKGTEPLDISEATIDSAEFSVVSHPTRVDPGDTDTIEILFVPAGSDDRGATLRISSNDPASPEVGIAVSALGYEGPRITESFRYTPSNPTDIVFVVATDDGMSVQLDKAAEVIPRFVDTLRDTNIDYHLTALSGAGPCPSTTPGWADRSDTSLQAEYILEHGLYGDPGPWSDDLAALALEAVTLAEAGECLVDFRRPEADLHVIVIADGPSEGDAARSAASLAARVDSPAVLHVSALVPEAGCGEVAADYAGLVETYGGALEDLCAPDWEDAFDAFADLPTGRGEVRYTLAEVPVVSTVEVLAEGVAYTSWTWDAVANAIVFDGDSVPALGAEITVQYVGAVACD